MFNIYKTIRCILYLFLFSFYIFVSIFFIQAITKSFSNKKISEAIFFDVGQGDSFFLNSPEIKILIDGGPDNSVLEKLASHLNYFSREIDFVLISHFHDDHFFGLIEVFKRYKINNLIYSSENDDNKILKTIVINNESDYLKKYRGIKKIISISSILNISKKDINVKIYSPIYFKAKTNNNNSLLTIIDINNLKILLSGDNEKEIENLQIKSGIDLRADIFKVSHHGSLTSNTINFLNKIKMKQAVISVGADNRFNHPNEKVIERLKSVNSLIYRTDTMGDVTFNKLLD